MNIAQIITESRANFYSQFRFWRLSAWAYNFLLPTRWIIRDRDRRFIAQYRDQFALFKRGRIVWGHLVQANNQMFEPGEQNLPGNVVYSPAPYFDNRLSSLSNISKYLFALKNQTLNHPETKDIKIFADAITSETRGLLNVEIPRSLTENQPVFFTSLVFHRKHLPTGYLRFSWFPLLVAPERTPAVMVLPARYWPISLLTAWLGLALFCEGEKLAFLHNPQIQDQFWTSYEIVPVSESAAARLREESLWADVKFVIKDANQNITNPKTLPGGDFKDYCQGITNRISFRSLRPVA